MRCPTTSELTLAAPAYSLPPNPDTPAAPLPYTPSAGGRFADKEDAGSSGLEGDMMGLGIAPSSDAAAARTDEDSFM